MRKALNSLAMLIRNFADLWSETDVLFSSLKSFVVQLARGKAIRIARIFASSRDLIILLLAEWR